MTRKNEKVSEAQLSFLSLLDPLEAEFLNSLPEAQRLLVQAFAAIEGVTYSQAFAILLGHAVEEDIADRTR